MASVKRVWTLPKGQVGISKYYPSVVKEVGKEGRRSYGGLPPSSSITNCGSVFQVVKTFGQKQRNNPYVLSPPVQPKKR